MFRGTAKVGVLKILFKLWVSSFSPLRQHDEALQKSRDSLRSVQCHALGVQSFRASGNPWNFYGC